MTADKTTEIGLDVKKIHIPASLSEMVYQTLKESLLKTDSSQISDGGRLDERELAARLGVSRTPLREAINRLVTEGFLNVVPRKGVFIVKVSKQELIEILLIRASLEGLGARLATEHITDKDIFLLKKIFAPFNHSNVNQEISRYADANVRFHEKVLKTSRCEKLIELASKLSDQIRMIRLQTIPFGKRPVNSLKEHLSIIEALENRKPNLAEKWMREHIEGLANHVRENVESLP